MEGERERKESRPLEGVMWTPLSPSSAIIRPLVCKVLEEFLVVVIILCMDSWSLSLVKRDLFLWVCIGLFEMYLLLILFGENENKVWLYLVLFFPPFPGYCLACFILIEFYL